MNSLVREVVSRSGCSTFRELVIRPGLHSLIKVVSPSVSQGVSLYSTQAVIQGGIRPVYSIVSSFVNTLGLSVIQEGSYSVSKVLSQSFSLPVIHSPIHPVNQRVSRVFIGVFS